MSKKLVYTFRSVSITSESVLLYAESTRFSWTIAFDFKIFLLAYTGVNPEFLLELGWPVKLKYFEFMEIWEVFLNKQYFKGTLKTSLEGRFRPTNDY